MTDKTWKQLERRVASKLNGKRNPYSGAVDMVTRADVILCGGPLRDYFIEVKQRSAFAHHSLFTSIETNARKEGKKVLLVTQVKNYPGELVTLRLDDLVDLLGGPGSMGEAHG